MTDLKTIYYDIGNAVKGICARTYAQSRPTAAIGRPDSYIVVSLPSVLTNREIDGGGGYNDYVTTAQIEVYVRDKVSPLSPNGFSLAAMSEKVSAVLSAFPIVTGHIAVTRPEVTMQDNDGNGYGVTIIQGRLRTK